MIRDGWLESERIDSLDVHAERFFIRLCLKADDFGRFHANPQLLKSMLFPLKEDIRSTDISRCLTQCEAAGLFRCYEVAGRRYLEIENFGQRLRTMASKFPSPDGSPPQPADKCPRDADNPPPEVEEKGSRRRREGEGACAQEPKPLCTLEQAKSYAPTCALTAEEAEHWWHARNSAGWLKATANGGAPRKITSFQSDMKTSASWIKESFAKTKNGGKSAKEFKSDDYHL